MLKDDEMENVSGGRLKDGWEKFLRYCAYNAFKNGASFDDFISSYENGTYDSMISKGGLSEDDKTTIAGVLDDIKKYGNNFHPLMIFGK